MREKGGGLSGFREEGTVRLSGSIMTRLKIYSSVFLLLNLVSGGKGGAALWPRSTAF